MDVDLEREREFNLAVRVSGNSLEEISAGWENVFQRNYACEGVKDKKTFEKYCSKTKHCDECSYNY